MTVQMTRKEWKVGRLVIETSRFPNQGYGWFPHKNGKGPKALFNSQGSRFGAGWNYKLGIDIGSSAILLNLLFGMVMFRLDKK